MGPISFPGLGLKFVINPVAFQVGPISVYWYGIIIATGFMAAVLLTLRNSHKFGINQEQILDMVLIATPVAIVGARLYYVAFSWEYYKNNPGDIIKTWEGGIAIYGAIIAAVITAYFFARKKNIKFLRLIDLAAPYLALAQAIGRWGNFVNQEAYGKATNLPWRMEIMDEGLKMVSVHPTFLYESLWNLINFGILIWYREKKKKVDGEIFLLYMAIYGAGRAWIEGLRTDSLMLGSIRISQLLAILFTIAGLVLFFVIRKKAGAETAEVKEENLANEEKNETM